MRLELRSVWLRKLTLHWNFMKLEKLPLGQISLLAVEIKQWVIIQIYGITDLRLQSKLSQILKGHLDTMMCKTKHLLLHCNSSFPLNSYLSFCTIVSPKKGKCPKILVSWADIKCTKAFMLFLNYVCIY